jgi:hypothetical protein
MSGAGTQLTALVVGLVGLSALGAAIGGLVDRRTRLVAWNWYLADAAAAALLALSVAAGAGRTLSLSLGALLWALLMASVAAARSRTSHLASGSELRDYERSRVMFWTAWKERARGPRVRIASQGELVVERGWPEDLPYVPLSKDESVGRVPRGQGRHILVLGGTGSGKTVSADRIALGRVLADRVPALVLDPKGDERLRRDLEGLARYVGRPFVVFDPMDERSDRWDPLWSAEPGRTVARVLAPIQSSEPYYADTLRIHLGVVSEALQLLGLWPVSMPALLEAAQAAKFAEIRKMVQQVIGPPALHRRVEEQCAFISSQSGSRDIASGAARLRVVVGTSWREVLTPRADGRAVQLPAAMRAGAIVLWRTWVEDLPDEAEAITTLALADMIASATEVREETEWLVLLDEFGSVMAGNAARRALGILGRARSSGGQAIVVTQSAADVPSATSNEALLEALADNFSAFVVHRQTSNESRGWVGNLMGTRELWRSTDRTLAGGRFAEGTGSRRRAREFLVRPDDLRELDVGEAYVWTPGGPIPERVRVAIAPRLAERPEVAVESVYVDAGPSALPERERAVSDQRRNTEPRDQTREKQGEIEVERQAVGRRRDGEF